MTGALALEHTRSHLSLDIRTYHRPQSASVHVVNDRLITPDNVSLYVTERHEVPPRLLNTHDQHTHRLLSEIEAGQDLSQRSLARSLGIALGLTNLLLRRVVHKGWVRMIRIRRNRVRYLLTPTGIAEKARMSRDSLRYSVRFYTDARNRIRERFSAISAEWPPDSGEETGQKRIVFYGTGEIAEIGYICLQETDLQLIGAVDHNSRARFFDVPVYPASDLCGRELRGMPFDRLVVTAFDHSESTETALQSANVPPDRVIWL